MVFIKNKYYNFCRIEKKTDRTIFLVIIHSHINQRRKTNKGYLSVSLWLSIPPSLTQSHEFLYQFNIQSGKRLMLSPSSP